MCLQDLKIGYRKAFRLLGSISRPSAADYPITIPQNSRRLGLIVTTFPSALSTATWSVVLAQIGGVSALNYTLAALSDKMPSITLTLEEYGLIMQDAMVLTNRNSTEQIVVSVTEIYAQQDLAAAFQSGQLLP